MDLDPVTPIPIVDDAAMPEAPCQRRETRIRIVLIYAAFAALWILLSDLALKWLLSDPEQITLASTFKGWFFVAVSSLLLYGLLRRQAVSGAEERALPRAKPFRGFLLPALLILGITGIGIAYNLAHQREKEVARLQTIADLKAGQVGDWLEERRHVAEFMQTSTLFAEQYRRWHDEKDEAEGERLQSRLMQVRQYLGFHALTLLDPQGERFWAMQEAPAAIAPILRAAVDRAIKDRTIQRVGPYLAQAGHVRLDYVIPLSISNPALIVVMHIDPGEWLYPKLKGWPVPSESGDTLLFRQDGEDVLYLNDPRHRPDTALKLRVPMTNKAMLSVQVLRGNLERGGVVEGLDYRGVRVLGVARAIPGTDWFLLAKLDRAELYGDAMNALIWIGLVGLLALFMAGAGLTVLRQREDLALALATRRLQSERIHALGLLAAVAEGSDDAIFAKDREGRYILFNRAASQFVGKPVEEALGRDDRALFPPDQAEMLMAIDRRVMTGGVIETNEEVLETVRGTRTFLATKGPLRDGEGKIIGQFGISRDISERKQAETALRESEARFRELFENMGDGVAIYEVAGDGEDFYFTAHNKAGECITGVPVSGAIGRSVREVFPGIEAMGLLTVFQRVWHSGEPEHFPLTQYLDEKLRLWVDNYVFRLPDGKVVAIYRDVTQQHLAEDALRESEARYRSVVDNIKEVVFQTDAQGLWTFLNRAWTETTGFSVEESLGTLFLDYVHPDDRQRNQELFVPLIQRKEEYCRHEVRYLCKEGGFRWIEVYARLTLDAADNIVGTSGTLNDITSRKAAEEELRRNNDELERFNRAMIGRELFVIELKKQINALSERLGEGRPFPLAFLDEAEPGQQPEDKGK